MEGEGVTCWVYVVGRCIFLLLLCGSQVNFWCFARFFVRATLMADLLRWEEHSLRILSAKVGL